MDQNSGHLFGQPRRHRPTAARPPNTAADDEQKWAFNPVLKPLLKAKPSTSYKKRRKRTLSSFSNPITTTEKALQRRFLGGSGEVSEAWVSCGWRARCLSTNGEANGGSGGCNRD
ncbi:hypothetical protein CXB51_015432 [Gossypium anomalum]|uniref:Uncharacterized protein n=1 Tax=Gossypium anomalum TaxID=47600 RepID=A0A8J5Z8C4_9ROSI|nr:hypothetical protein CXB51_015432 [Gossypium anomalum]